MNRFNDDNLQKSREQVNVEDIDINEQQTSSAQQQPISFSQADPGQMQNFSKLNTSKDYRQ